MEPRTLVHFDRRPMTELRAGFRWNVPAEFNIGVDVCDKWAGDRDRVALVDASADPPRSYTFAELRDRSNRWANALAALGVGPGDRVAVVMSQRPETALAHLATYKLGGVAVPLATLFGEDALEYRLRDSGARAVVLDGQAAPRFARIRDRLPNLSSIIAVDAEARAIPGALDAAALEERAADRLTPRAARAEDPAGILYTSGTTGPPKGAVVPHRALIGHLPAFCLFHDLAPQPGDRLWSPADWAWIGGLFNVLLAGWHYGLPVVAYRQTRFDPERAFWLLERYGIRNAFIFPTALKLMRQVPPERRAAALRLRSVCSAGEPVGEELVAWGREHLGVTINEFYGQTEMNLVTGNCGAVQPVKPGSIGTPYPGHHVDVLDESGVPARAGDVGEIAVRRPDPVMFLGYWNDPEATARKFRGDWALMGDLGVRDADGYLWFTARKDDLIKSGAYRIGPGEVEECLLRHPAVALAAVIGVPDPERGHSVKAFICLAPGRQPSPALATDLQNWVKSRVGFHAYPRLVEFVAELPLTTTGKLQRYVLRARGQTAAPTDRTQGTAPKGRESLS